jgi:hypothetical protein
LIAEELKEIVGVNNIHYNETILEDYSQDFTFDPKVRLEHIVKLKSTAELQVLKKRP